MKWKKGRVWFFDRRNGIGWVWCVVDHSYYRFKSNIIDIYNPDRIGIGDLVYFQASNNFLIYKLIKI